MFMLRDARGQVYPIPEQGLRIGRAAGNDLPLADEEVSRYHATVWVHGGQAYIRDENSTNGTWVNERRISAPTPLRPGDRIRVGKTVLEVLGREPGATVVSMPGVAYPPPAPAYPAAPPVAPPLAPSAPRRSRLPLILGLGAGGLLLLCGATILILLALKVPLPGIAPRPSPTPTPTPTPIHTPTPTSTPTPEPTPTPSNAWIIIMTEDFEGDFPGDWELVSDSKYEWGRSTCRAYSGSYSAWAVGGGDRGRALNCGSRYPTSISVGMHYGPFSLKDATAAELRFRFWMDTEPLFDRFCWGASANGDDFFGTCKSGDADWSEEVLDLSDVPTLGDLLGHSNVWIAFYFHSDDSDTRPEGAYVDDIVLRKCLYPGGRCR